MPLLSVTQRFYYARHEVAHLADGSRGPAHDHSQQRVTPQSASPSLMCLQYPYAIWSQDLKSHANMMGLPCIHDTEDIVLTRPHLYVAR